MQRAEALRKEEMQRVAEERRVLLLLEQREAEQNMYKKMEAENMKAEWKQQTRDRKMQEKALADRARRPIEPEQCGMAALQVFDGEDRIYQNRTQMQKQQIKEWNQQQMSEKQMRDQASKEEDERYGEYMRMVNNARQQQEADEQAERKRQLMEINAQNRAMARDHALKNAQAKLADETASASEVQQALNDPVLTEDMSVARSALGDNRVRPERFKGFSSEERMRFYQENEQMIQEKQARKQMERQLDLQYDAEQDRIRCMVEVAEQEEMLRQKDIVSKQMAELALQKRENDQRKEMSRKERFGKIDEGLYSGFGQSGR